MNLNVEPAVTPEETVKKRPFYEPGWYRELSNEEYHGSFGTSSSQLKKLIEKTPAHLDYDRRHPQESTKNMHLGTAMHTLVLEPENFDKEVAVMPILNLRTNAGKAEKAAFDAENAGKTIITQSQLEQAQAMAAAVKEHPIASILLQDVVTESSVYWWYKSMDPDDDTRYKEMLKVRPDALGRSHNVIIDLKSTSDGSYTGFIKAIQNFYYHVSAAMYLEGVNQCKPLLQEMGHWCYKKFVFICVENVAPYLVSVYELSPEYIEIGKLHYRRALQRLRDGRESDWPGFPDEVRVIEPPSWANRSFIV